MTEKGSVVQTKARDGSEFPFVHNLLEPFYFAEHIKVNA